jgi:2,3-bisphosphoglycerate-dependent phosphoglycerate mutase
MAYLVLIRHGQSEWNAKSLWTGWTDVDLTERGREQARDAAEKIKDMSFDICFTSELKRAKQTWGEVSRVIGAENVKTVSDTALNERNYGDLTGKNKWEVEKQLGDEEFLKIRRSWDYPPLNGESLKDVYERVVSYYNSYILPELRGGKNVIVVAHGNSLRALVKLLENISDEKIYKLEMKLGEPFVYEIDSEGGIVSKKILSIGSEVA